MHQDADPRMTIHDVSMDGDARVWRLRTFRFESEFFDLLVQGVAIDPQSYRRLCLNSLAAFEDLLDQLAFNERDDLLIQVGRRIAGRRHSLGNQFAAERFRISSARARQPDRSSAAYVRGKQIEAQMSVAGENNGPL